MTMESIGELNYSAPRTPSNPRQFPGIPNTPEELAARTIHCTVCNAPPECACQHILWHGSTPTLKPRKYHGRRLKDSERSNERRRRLDATAGNRG